MSPASVCVDGLSGARDHPAAGRSELNTTLVENFLATIKARGDAVILSGRCYQRESVPFKASTACCTQAAAESDELRAVMADLRARGFTDPERWLALFAASFELEPPEG